MNKGIGTVIYLFFLCSTIVGFVCSIKMVKEFAIDFKEYRNKKKPIRELLPDVVAIFLYIIVTFASLSFVSLGVSI